MGNAKLEHNLFSVAKPTSIRDRYIVGNLIAKHSLTAVDMKHLVQIIDLKEKIKVLAFTPASLGELLEASKDKIEPVHGLLYLPNADNTLHWVAATFSIDPAANTVTYTLDDAAQLTEEQKQKYRDIVNAAIDKCSRPLQISNVAIKDGSLKKEEEYGSGYLALQKMLQRMAPPQLNDDAKSYAQQDDLKKLIANGYKLLLEDLMISQEEYKALGATARKLFSSLNPDGPKIRINRDRLNRFLEELPDTLPAPQANTIHPDVQDFIRGYSSQWVLVQFPQGVRIPDLNAKEYEHFFDLLHSTLKDKNLPLRLSHCDIATLDGLNAYYQHYSPTLFKELTISVDLSPEDNAEEYIAKLEFALSNLSRTGLQHLKIEDVQGVLKAEHVKELYQFIQKHQLAIRIDLPKTFQDKEIQRQLDADVEVNLRHKRSQSLSGQKEKEEFSVPLKARVKRTRHANLDFRDAMKIDVELQQGLEDTEEFEETVVSTSDNEQSYNYTLIKESDIWYPGDLYEKNPNLSGHTRRELAHFWNKVAGNIELAQKDILKFNLTVKGSAFDAMTTDALKQLMQFKEYYQYGLNSQQLPPGFLLIHDEQLRGFVLHYAPKLLPRDNIAPMVIASPGKPIWSVDLVNELLTNARVANTVISIWDKLQKDPSYQREDNELFRQILPQLLSLKEEHVLALVNRAGGIDHCDIKRLGTLLDSLSQAENLYQARHSAESPLTEKEIKEMSWLPEVLGKSDLPQYIASFDEFINLAHDIKQNVNIEKVDPLKLILERKGLKELSDRVTALKLNEKQSHGLLSIYDQYDEAGLIKLLNLWDDWHIKYNKTNSDQLICIKEHVSGYAQLLENSNEVEEALKYIAESAELSKEDRQWWDKLYTAHQPKDDYYPNLVNSFRQFRRLMDKNLQLYNLSTIPEPLFSGADNLPSTLGRMLTILNACKETDKNAQWQVMAKLDLSATGAVRAMTISDSNHNERPAGFILPEMDIKAESAAHQVGHDEYKSHIKIAQQKYPDALLKAFYGYVAHQKYRLPLEIYQQVAVKIEETSLSRKTKNYLYSIIAGATTGDNYQYFISDAQSAQMQCENIFKYIQRVSLSAGTEAVQENLVEALADISTVPALPILEKLMNMLTTPLQNVGLMQMWGLQTIAAKLLDSSNKLSRFVARYGDLIYLGMKFYDQKDFSKDYQGRTLFEEHLEVCRKIEEAGFAKELFPMVSVFKLNSNNVDAVLEILKPLKDNDEFRIKKYVLGNLLKHLLDADPKKMEDLNSERLIAFLKRFMQVNDFNTAEILKNVEEVFPLEAGKRTILATESSNIAMQDRFQLYKLLFSNFYKGVLEEEQIEGAINASKYLNGFISPKLLDLLEESFAAVFPPNYIKSQRAGDPSPNLQLQINREFKEKDSIDKIYKILKQFDGASEESRDKLLTQLIRINRLDKGLLNLLADDRILDTSLSSYEIFLDLLKPQHLGRLNSFIARANKITPPVQDLMNKVIVFLRDALEPIHDQEVEVLKELDVLPVMQELILHAQANEFQNNLYPQLNIALGLYQQAIASDPLDIATIKITLNELRKEIAAQHFPDSSFTQELNDIAGTLERGESTKIITVAKTRPKVGESQSYLQKGWGYLRSFWTAPPAVPELESYTESTEVPLDYKLSANAMTQLNQQITQTQSYAYNVRQTFNDVRDLVQAYPTAKKMLLNLVQHLVSYNPDKNVPQIVQVLAHLNDLKKELLPLKDQDLVISLCEHFGEGGEKSKYTYQQLLALFQGKTIQAEGFTLNFAKYPNLSLYAKKQILNVISIMLDNKKPFSLAEVEQLIERSSDPRYGKAYSKYLEQLFARAPYPTLDLAEKWWQKAKDTRSISSIFKQDDYLKWNKQPVIRDTKNNGFKLEIARKQVQLMTGVHYADRELINLDALVKKVQQYTTEELLTKIHAVKNEELSRADRASILVPLMAELLYRTKALPPTLGPNGEPIENGYSFELNTTQYLALHSLLKTGQHVTSETGTGEGKTRIMMLGIACQYVMGNTVDFVTKDLALATRDYLQFRAFFKVLGAQTNMIYAQSPAEEYRLKGINFSDGANLSLFRNKARSEGKEDLVIDKDPTKRALMLDEKDSLTFDSTNTRYNYSTQADPLIRDMPWVYELMVEFIYNDNHGDKLFTNDADLCNERFLIFAKNRITDKNLKSNQISITEADYKRLEELSQEQIEAWQTAAQIAFKMKYKEHFVLADEKTILAKGVPVISAQALLVAGDRSSTSAKYSFGVHQCLHARLNFEKRNPGKSEDPKLARDLQGIKNEFHIDSEKQIVYSTTSKTFLDDYHEGEVMAITGTAGSVQEKAEAAVLYGTSTQKMAFVEMPRHKGQKRVDLPIALTKNELAQQQNILASVRESLKNNQPVLLICKDITAVDKLHAFLENSLTESERSMLKKIHAGTDVDEAHHVDKIAGQSGSITISTPMLGRGTDIPLHGPDARAMGLKVLVNFLPRYRDFWQIIGRAGRQGMPGISQMILNAEEISKQFGEVVLPTELYTATEDYVHRMQTRMDAKEQKSRLIILNAADAKRKFSRDNFFTSFSDLLRGANQQQRDFILTSWRDYHDKVDKAWNKTWPNIQKLLEQSPIEEAALNKELDLYQTAVAELWKSMRNDLDARCAKVIADVNKGPVSGEVGEQAKIVEKVKQIVEQQLHKELPEQKLSADIIGLLKSAELMKDSEALRTIVATEFHEAYVGRAVIYTHFIDSFRAFFKNIAAALRGESVWFPNLQAAQNGNMSWSQFFFGTWGTPLPKTELDAQAKSAPLLSDFTASTEGMLDMLRDLGNQAEENAEHEEIVEFKEIEEFEKDFEPLGNYPVTERGLESTTSVKKELREMKGAELQNDSQVKPGG